MKHAGAPSCASCRHFEDDPEAFEQAFPGLLALGSGRGDARGDQGLCRVHGRMVPPGCTCELHISRKSIMVQVNGTRQDQSAHPRGGPTSSPVRRTEP